MPSPASSGSPPPPPPPPPLILRNLLGDGDTVYSAYESQRVRRIRSGDTLCYAPHATRLTYAYPRSFYLTVSYRF